MREQRLPVLRHDVGGRDYSAAVRAYTQSTSSGFLSRPRRDAPRSVWSDVAAHDHAGARGHRGRLLSELAKSGFDRSVALAAIVLLSPILLMVAALIRLRDPGPVLFAHKRIGHDGKVFPCFKFRTMAMNGDAILSRHLAVNPAAAREWKETRKLRRDPRVTPLGDVLRRSSIDELPQLLNILRGEMSLVGPRPIVQDEVPHYGPVIDDYMSVKPGLTGLWQISGRNDIGYDERVALDREYVRNRSFAGDIAIILRTVRVVLSRQGSY